MRYIVLVVTYSVLLPLAAKPLGDWLTKYGIESDQAAYDAWLIREQAKFYGDH